MRLGRHSTRKERDAAAWTYAHSGWASRRPTPRHETTAGDEQGECRWKPLLAPRDQQFRGPLHGMMRSIGGPCWLAGGLVDVRFTAVRLRGTPFNPRRLFDELRGPA